ncbi:MAG: ABC transporter ATP-binding protein [Erysipelotrichaceae bacterium]|nr:ABC transporter ATP-binding protein [Erysipelotrichaceae bacterium]
MKKYYKKYAYLLIFGILANVVVDYVQLYIPEYLGQIVEIVRSSESLILSDISTILIMTMLVSLILFIGRIIMRYCILGASSRMEAAIRHDMFLKSERLSQRYYHQNKAGSIMSVFTSDTETIEEFVGWGTVMLVDAIFLSTLSLYKMFRLDFVLSAITIIPMLILIIWGNSAEKIMSNLWLKRQENFDKLFDFTQENFTGIRVIKAFVKEKQEQKAFDKVAKENAEVNVKFGMQSVGLDVSIEVLIGLIMALLLGLGGYFVYLTVNGNPFILFNHQVIIKPGDLVTFIGYVDTLIWPMMAMGMIMQVYSRYSASSKRIIEFLNQEEEIKDSDNCILLNNCKGNIEFKNFSFNYPGTEENVLKNISLSIKEGELIGVVGKIGSGKSTLVNSLLHLYNVENNQIFIDGIDIMDISLKSLRDNIAYVPQDNFLFSDTVANNIAFSDMNSDIKNIEEAAVFADVDENIRGFMDDYDTVTGERGVTLSGGQKQRISIARAYLKEAPIMILDDSVSAVDVKTEETIISNILNKRKGKTTILIASRLSTVKRADKIIVLKNGELEAFDTPERLMEISKTYQKMSYLQQLESEL